MGSVSLFNLGNIIKKFDFDGNGKLDRSEIAQAALSLMNNPETATEGRLMATFVQGGKNGNGLMPDTNGDGALSFSELAQLACRGGGCANVDVADFKAAFPGQTAEGGSSINIEKLKQLAPLNDNKFLPQEDAGNAGNSESSSNSRFPGLPLILMIFGGGNGNGNNIQNNGQNTNPLMQLFGLFAMAFSMMFANLLGRQ